MHLFLFMQIWYILKGIKGEDCHGNHMTLPYLERRSSNYTLNYDIDDYELLPGWYDVGRNNMPTDSKGLTINTCGTIFPIWMRGSVPEAYEGKVTRIACMITTNTDCEEVGTIEVINCGTHMLYKLLSTAAHWAYEGYCFDPTDLLDAVTVQPRLVFKNETGIDGRIFKKPQLEFHCDFHVNETEMYYTVSWYVNDIFLINKGPVLATDINKTNLHEQELTEKGLKLDINIKCVVSSSYSREDAPGNHTTSAQYWLGIRVLNPTVALTQGKTATIELQPTFPFGCSSRAEDINPEAKCLMSVQMFDPDDSNDCESSSISVRDSQKCGVEIIGFYYHQWTPGARYDSIAVVTITTKDPNDYHQDRNRFVLKLRTSGTGINYIAQGSYINDIIVTATFQTEWQAKTCYSYVDPHMRSFDGKPYENQNEGIFVMYRHNSSKQEVQMETKRCNSYATCTCAVAVRAGGDIFLIDLCRSTGLIKHVSCKENILDVRQINPYLYKPSIFLWDHIRFSSCNIYILSEQIWLSIHMPLGTMVSVAINHWPGYESTLNLNIYPSVKDVHETIGLCGVLNDNQGDDFTTPSRIIVYNNDIFAVSWRIGLTESFFNPQNHDPDLWDENSLFCVCPAALNTTTLPSTSSGSEFDPLCSASLSLSCSSKVNVQGTQYQTCNIRTKRSKQSMSKEIERILRREVVDNDIKTHRVEKRSIINITLDEAFAECTAFFATNCTTALFQDSLPSSNRNSMNSSITNCALDYLYTGNMSLASLHCETYRSEVDEEIGRNSTFREANPDVVESFRAMTCINNCNNHGDCVNGSCICHAMYIEEDCSVSLSNYPAVEDTYAGGLCQKDKDDCCGEVPIYGSRFVKGITKQKLEIFNIYLNGNKVVEELRIQVIPILNPFEAQISVPCAKRSQRSTDADNSSIPFVTETRVSLTNDDTNYGPAKSYYILDSKCQGILNRTDGYTFYLLDGTCFISGTCYNEREQDSLDRCKRCQPTINRFSWTYECTSSKDPLVVTDMKPILISVCIGTLVIVLVIVTIAIIKCCLKKKKRIAGHVEINVTVPTTGQRKFDKTLLFCSQQSLRDSGIVAKGKNDDSCNATGNNRPGTPGSMSFQKIFLQMELPEN